MLSEEVIEHISRSNSKVRVLTFEHRLLVNETFSWQTLLDAGGKLRDALVDLHTASEVNGILDLRRRLLNSAIIKANRPIILIGHSFGGTILKQVQNASWKIHIF